MSENNADKQITMSLSEFVKIESTLASFSESLEVTMVDDKKSSENANTVLGMLSEIRKKNDLCAEDGY